MEPAPAGWEEPFTWSRCRIILLSSRFAPKYRAPPVRSVPAEPPKQSVNAASESVSFFLGAILGGSWATHKRSQGRETAGTHGKSVHPSQSTVTGT
eukprot:5777371-Prymnesium_polylepis.1